MDYVNAHNLEWLNVWDPYNTSNFRNNYDIYSTPVIYLLNKDRKIVAKRIGVDQIVQMMDNLSKDEKKSN